MFHPLTKAKYIQTKKLVHISVSQFYQVDTTIPLLKIMPENMYELKALSYYNMFMYVIGTLFNCHFMLNDVVLLLV